MIETALAQLGRFAFFTRDNPFASMQAGEELPPEQREVLGGLVEGSVDVPTWLGSEEGRALLADVDLACLPRDLQLTGDRSVTVTSVFAFLDAPLFWWVVSTLWCMSVGRRLDAALDPGVKGYRLHTHFVEDPGTSGFIFKNPSSSYEAWKRHIARESQTRSGQVLAANMVDLASFYYSVIASPSAIAASLERNLFGLSTSERECETGLTLLLDAVHAAYAARSREIQPRPIEADDHRLLPLPVGLPSSPVLANVIVTQVLADLRENPFVVGVAAYADDLVVLTPHLPEPLEPITDYFERLGLVAAADVRLRSARGSEHAVLTVNIEKSGTSYSRSIVKPDAPNGEDEDDGEVEEQGQIDPYLDADPGAEWGGPLRTVLRAPQRRERAPRALERELASLVGDIAVGVDPDEIRERLERLLVGMDPSVFLRLRRYWPDLIVAGVTADGLSGLSTLTEDFVGAIAALELTATVPKPQREALFKGLRASWFLAVAQALAVAMDDDDRATLPVDMPTFVAADRFSAVTAQGVSEYAARIRDRGLVPAQFVSVPLSEFTNWPGRLIGADVFTEFVEWARQDGSEFVGDMRSRVSRALRFIQLHEACLAVHLWASPGSPGWLDSVFQLLRAQPLVRAEDVAELQLLALACVQPATPTLPSTPMARARLSLNIAIPSVRVSSVQLDAIIDGNRQLQAAIVKESRSRTRAVAQAAAKRKADVLVLPEWAVLPQQLSWLMDRARRSEMLLVAGQAPTVQNDVYSNKLWTGIPLKDNRNRRSCLVPPPREKNYLSPHEQEPLSRTGISHRGGSAAPLYRWRGLGVASLICFEFADVSTRHLLRAGADLLTVSSLNRDWRYFDAIQESTTRDNYCLTLCVNTSEFPGTRLMRPTRSEKAVIAAVHGSDYPAVVMRRVDLLPIVAARAQRAQPSTVLSEQPRDDLSLEDYKPVPPVW